jgi:hypothetical protein
VITKGDVSTAIKSVIGSNPIPVPTVKDIKQADSLLKKADTLLRKKIDPLKTQ